MKTLDPAEFVKQLNILNMKLKELVETGRTISAQLIQVEKMGGIRLTPAEKELKKMLATIQAHANHAKLKAQAEQNMKNIEEVQGFIKEIEDGMEVYNTKKGIVLAKDKPEKRNKSKNKEPKPKSFKKLDPEGNK